MIPGLGTVLAFLAPLAAYLLTLSGSLAVDDSPETVTCMVTLEHQHPPGYPLMTLLGKLVTLLPAGGPGWRGALLAAVGAALAVALASRLARHLARDGGADERQAGLASLFTAVLAASSWTMWMQALSAKGAAYTLNAALLAALMLLLLRPGEGTPATPFLFGLGLAHHWMSVLASLPGLLVLRGRKKVRIRGLALAAFLAFLGVSTYLFLPMRSSTPLLLNWGRPERARQFYEVVTRAMYREVEAIGRPEGYWGGRLRHLWSWTWREMTPLLGWTVLPGLWWLWRRNRRGFRGFVATGLGVAGGAILVAHPLPGRYAITEPYLLPVSLLWAVTGGLGLAWVSAAASRKRGWVAGVVVAATLAVVLPRSLVVSHSHSHLSTDYGWNILAGCPKNAVVFCEGDIDLFSLIYHHQVEGRRPDVAVVSAAFLDYPWYRETVHRQLPDMIPREANIGEYVVKPIRPLVYTAQHPGGEEVLRPVGLVLRPPLGEGWGLDDSARLWRNLRMRGLWSPPPGSEWLVRFLTGAYALQLVRVGMVAAREGRAEMAVDCYREALLFPQELRERGLRRYVYASALLGLHKVDEAAVQLEQVVAEVPWFPRGWVLLANVDHISGDDGAARLHLERALSLLPEQGAEGERARVSGLLRNLGR